MGSKRIHLKGRVGKLKRTNGQRAKADLVVIVVPLTQLECWTEVAHPPDDVNRFVRRLVREFMPVVITLSAVHFRNVAKRARTLAHRTGGTICRASERVQMPIRP